MLNSAITVFAESDNPTAANYKKKIIYIPGNEYNCSVVIDNSNAYKKDWKKALCTVYADWGYDLEVYTLYGEHRTHWWCSDEVRTHLDANSSSKRLYYFKAGILSSKNNAWTSEKQGTRTYDFYTSWINRKETRAQFIGYAHK